MTVGPSPPSKPVRSDKSSLEYVTSSGASWVSSSGAPLSTITFSWRPSPLDRCCTKAVPRLYRSTKEAYWIKRLSQEGHSQPLLWRPLSSRAGNGSLRVTHDPSDPLSSWPMTHVTHDPWVTGVMPHTSASLTQINRLPGAVFGHCICTHTPLSCYIIHM